MGGGCIVPYIDAGFKNRLTKEESNNDTYCYSINIISKNDNENTMRVGRLHSCFPPKNKEELWIGKTVRSIFTKKWTGSIEFDRNENIIGKKVYSARWITKNHADVVYNENDIVITNLIGTVFKIDDYCAYIYLTKDFTSTDHYKHHGFWINDNLQKFKKIPSLRGMRCMTQIDNDKISCGFHNKDPEIKIQKMIYSFDV